MNVQCLIIDDDRVIAETTADYFNMFDISAAYVLDYDSAIAFLNENTVSLILLDINLGERSGFELCKQIRESYNMPILFISARTSDNDVLTALNIGGDDYIKKPYSLNILLAKVKAILNRYEQAQEVAKTADGEQNGASGTGISGVPDKVNITNEIALDTKAMKIIKGKEQIALKALEYKLLLYLLQNKNRVITKDELFERVWEDAFVGDGTLAVHIRHLREKLEDDPTNPVIIKTVWGVGYIIEEFA